MPSLVRAHPARVISMPGETQPLPLHLFPVARCAGDKAYALDASLVGSIGVISATFGAVETAHRLVRRGVVRASLLARPRCRVLLRLSLLFIQAEQPSQACPPVAGAGAARVLLHSSVCGCGC